jgi:isopentenyl diphosphate isomerase/L-lactate dehydrogenase-like FMN-dependent dehydrogenase
VARSVPARTHRPGLTYIVVALGATAVLIGRLYAYGLAAAVEGGACRVLDLLRQEIETVLVLLGRGGITDLNGSAVEWGLRSAGSTALRVSGG